MQPYSLDKEVTLTTYASKKTIAAVLIQDDHLVFHISRVLTPAEQKYSNIEREALATAWAIKRF